MQPMSGLSSPRRHPHHRGMTLLELLVVMLILAMLAGLFPLAIQRMVPARRLAAAAGSLAVDVRDLQSQAALVGQPLKLILESSGYRLPHMSDNDTRHVEWPASVKVTLKADSDAQATRTLVMYPDGSSSGGEFELHVDQRLTTVTVNPTTGRVRVTR